MSEQKIYCKGGGCTAKLGAGALDKVLSLLDKKEDPHLLVGYDSHDDGAVYQINDNQAIVTTLDFFPPMVEDPYTFGQIAAANAMSDIFAMGGKVLTALNIVCFPEKLDLNILGKILEGGNDKVKEAGGTLVGGHSIIDADIKYGLSVTGMVDPNHIYRNNTCQKDDVLLLTKKLGVGIIMTAKRIGEASDKMVEEAIASMCQLNQYDFSDVHIHACSDVTGFGFLVHLREMLDGKFSAVIDSKSIPYFEECPRYIEEFYLTAAAQKNRNFMGDDVLFEQENFILEEILFDPQTSGGLLISVNKEDAAKIKAKIPCFEVGKIIEKQDKSVIVR